jgi:hypothetical protein
LTIIRRTIPVGALIVSLVSAFPAGAGTSSATTVRPEDGGAAQVEFSEDPVVLVHGCFTTPDPELEPYWSDVREYLENAGYPTDRIYGIDNADDRQRIGLARERTDPRCISRLNFADRIGEFVDAVPAHTGAEKVDIATHSLGPPAVRLYLQAGGTAKVDDYVGLAGVDHGGIVQAVTYSIVPPLYKEGEFEGGKEMAPAYACDPVARNQVQTRLNGCLTPTGRLVLIDETPGGIEDGGQVDYLSIVARGDEVVEPWQSGCLNQRLMNDCSDRVNVEVDLGPPVPSGDPLRDLTYVRMLSDPRVLEMVLDHFTNHALILTR